MRGTTIKLVLLFSLMQYQLFAQSDKLTGSIVSAYRNNPVDGAIISMNIEHGVYSAETDSLGNFTFSVPSSVNLSDGDLAVDIAAIGYFNVSIPLMGRSNISVVLIPEDQDNYNLPSETIGENMSALTQTLNDRNFRKGALYLEDVMQGMFPGLYMVNKSGMPGEGSSLMYRGARSLYAENTPLIVLNGVPMVMDQNNSAIIGGYSRSILSGINVDNVENISFLKGADAAIYGSMGANGVLVIETSRAVDLDTRIEYSGQFGVATNQAKIPVLGPDAFKKYIGDVGLTQYDDAALMLEQFPFLKNDPDYFYNYLYNNNTDWQSLIYEPAFVTSNNLQVKGGDAIAKYNLSVGYLNQGGTLSNTNFARYNTRLNTNIALGKKVEFVSSIGYGYVKGNHQNQGLLEASNPVLTSLYKAPILDPYKKNENNVRLPVYDTYRQFNVSNPVAVVNTVSLKTDAYDLFFNAGLNFKMNEHTELSSMFGLYSGYSRQAGFVPGKSSLAIVPREEGIELNSASAGIGESANYYYNLSAKNWRMIGEHRLVTGLGYQGLVTRREFDAGDGRNTSSDFYKTLTYVDNEGAGFFGYIDLWNWMSVYGFATYDLGKSLSATLNFSYDGSSASGSDATRFGFFPGVSVKWNAKNVTSLSNISFINDLDVNVSYAMLGNSRFSSKLGKQYYGSQIYRQLSGIVSSNVANTGLTWEKNNSIDLGVTSSLFGYKLNVGINAFHTISSDIILPQQVSPVFGTTNLNINAGEITNTGLELDVQAYVYQAKDFSISVGGNLSTYQSKVTDLGNAEELVYTLPDGATLITKVGEAPYSFYGYKTDGIFSTKAEAQAAGLFDAKGDFFGAGDVHFVDADPTGTTNRIDEHDRTIIGDANPDFFGGMYLNVKYRQFTLSSYFMYSVGNQMYNATRRQLESVDGYYNQSGAVVRRWQGEGQITDVPRASYGDPMQNSRFSDRWIEDASYLRLTNLVIDYKLKKRTTGMIKGGDIYLTGENLFTATNYLGLDPGNAYAYATALQGVDYAKVALPRTFKVGFNLQF